MSKSVKLSPQEMITAGTVGLRRSVALLVNGKRSQYSAKNIGEEFERSIVGAMAEFVVAREFNLFWRDGVGSVASGDVGDNNIEVRCRKVGGVGLDLGIKASDSQDKPFVLVHADPPNFTMVGWMVARDAWEIGKESAGLRGVRFVAPMVPPLRDVSELHDVLFGRRVDIPHGNPDDK